MPPQAKGSGWIGFIAAVIAVVIVFLMLRAHKVGREPQPCTSQQVTQDNCEEKK